MRKYKLALVGATGVVGEITRKVLEEYNLPIEEYTFFASCKSAGKIIMFNNKEYEVQELKVDSFNDGFDYVIFLAGNNVSEKYIPIAVEHGCICIDNSSYYRMEKGIPLVVPEVNMEDSFLNEGIIANPDCAAIQTAVVISPLDKEYRIKRAVISTYQAVSGAGMRGIQDLQSGIESYIYGNKYELNKFPYEIFNNCIPKIGDFEDDRYTLEEHNLIDETRKILKKSSLPITATTVRVPLFNSYCESINLEFEKDYEINNIIEILNEAPGVVVKDDISNNLYPMPIDTNNQDRVFVGRIRRDYSVKSGINLWVVADNTRKGVGSNSVQILSGLIEKRNKTLIV